MCMWVRFPLRSCADVAQMVERLFRNQVVVGSTPIIGLVFCASVIQWTEVFASNEKVGSSNLSGGIIYLEFL